MRRFVQFNDGAGWRGNREVPADASTDQAIEFAKEHWGNLTEGGNGRWLGDHLRLVEQVGDDYRIIWWQDGATAEPKQGAI